MKIIKYIKKFEILVFYLQRTYKILRICLQMYKELKPQVQKKKGIFWEDILRKERKKCQAFQDNLAEKLKKEDLFGFEDLISAIGPKFAYEILKDSKLLLICICKGYFREFEKLLELVPDLNKTEIITSGGLVSFLIYEQSQSFKPEIFRKFIKYFMNIDYYYCLEVFNQEKSKNEEMIQCFLKISHEETYGNEKFFNNKH